MAPSTNTPDHGLTIRTGPAPVALETTLLAHGVPRSAAMDLHHDLSQTVRTAGATPALVGVVDGRPVVGMTDDELEHMLANEPVKVNTANLGLAMARGRTAATTVSATMELAAAAGVCVFATGGIGGVHRGYGTRLDISADLVALAHFPVAVVSSGVKSILDVESTREALESLGVPVIGYRTDVFPAFYTRTSDAIVDERMDDPADIAAFLASELPRTGRGVLIANPIPVEHEIPGDTFTEMLKQVAGPEQMGRDATPSILAALHDQTHGKTLEANLVLVRLNAQLAAEIAASLSLSDRAKN